MWLHGGGKANDMFTETRSLGVLEKIVSMGSRTAHRPARHLAVVRGKFVFLGAVSTAHLQIQAPNVGFAASNSWDAQKLENIYQIPSGTKQNCCPRNHLKRERS